MIKTPHNSVPAMLERRSYRECAQPHPSPQLTLTLPKKKGVCGSMHRIRAHPSPLQSYSLFPGQFISINACMASPTDISYINQMTHVAHRKYKSWKVSGLLPWSALLFTAGFIVRAIGAFGQWGNVPIFISSTVLLLAGP